MPKPACQNPAARLLDYYDAHARILPWRVPPAAVKRGERQDPYAVWLSEIMLQQTTTEAVKPYFAKFMQKWPDLAALNAAPLDEVMQAWAGLGYYSRARNLKACAAILTAEYGGQFPRSAAELKRLPGIGSYTAAAIAAIAFDEACAVVDANIERVIARLFCVETPLPKAKAEIHALCQSITPPQRAGDFAQAIMDLGASLCSVKSPSCLFCPLAELCEAKEAGKAPALPRKAPKKPREQRAGAAFIAVLADGSIYLEKRAAKGLLGGMSQPPNHFAPIKKAQEAEPNAQADLRFAPFAADWRFCGQITHIFTHFHLMLNIYKTEAVKEKDSAVFKAGFWVPPAALPNQALPTLFKKAIACALPGAFKNRKDEAKEEETKKRT